MTNDFKVLELRIRSRDVNRFLKLPLRLYPRDSLWVAPLLINSKRILSSQNPFFQHAEMRLWVVTLNGLDVGRIAGIIDRAHNDFHQENTAFFGFFECIQQDQVSRLLFETAFAWARNKNMRRFVGPVNPTINQECGLLIDGFETKPVFMTPYNPPYYADLINDVGFRKAKDLLAYDIDLVHAPLARYQRVLTKMLSREKDLNIRPVQKQTLERDLAKIREVFNDAWDNNWGFVPITEAEIDFMAASLKPILEDDFIWLAEMSGEPVGFAFGSPDYNELLKPLRGRLLTPGTWHLLSYMFGLKKLTRTRMMTLGVRKDFRHKGIEAAMLAKLVGTNIPKGYNTCEASWILEDNVAVQRVIELFGGVVYKTFRIYERDL